MNLPETLSEIQALPNWVAYKTEWDSKRNKSKKVPINPKTGANAKPNEPATWGTFEQAVRCATSNAQKQGLQIGQNHGVGFMFSGGYAGIDLDDVILPDGTLKDFAREIVDLMNSYTEYSPSGEGLHILFKVNDEKAFAGLFGKQLGKRDSEKGIEIYGGGRFFTVTGKIFEHELKINERTEAMKEIYTKYLKKEYVKQEQRIHTTVETWPSLSDSEVLEKMFNSRHGREIQALYNGDISGYGSQSEADLAFCNYLAYWTNRNPKQMDSIFRQCGLMRDKWDERHGAETYGEMTINKAIQGTPEYTPYLSVEPEKSVQNAQSQIEFVFNDTYLAENFEKDMSHFQKYESRKTGYENIDAKMSLYPGLYVIGAVSSLGKTTFSLQMADQLSKAGEHVMFFALEQTRFELTAKSLARLTATERNLKNMDAVSAIQIRSGRLTPTVREAITEYKKFASHSQIIECSFETTIMQITQTVKAYIERYKVRPIVFVDYLQMIKPLDIRQTKKDAVDTHVRALKKLQMDFDLVLFVISSLNRQNYLTLIDFESFKESGSIEYTADCVWGLQLFCMNQEVFNKEKELKTKREIVKAAKRANPREIELCILKNRYGIANESFYFKYYPQYDFFVPANLQ